MRVSTKGRYGLRILLDIAMHPDGSVALRDISRRQAISEKYLWQVINPLKAAGYVNSLRGAKGGYVLAKSPGEITILDVVTTLEGPISIVDCLAEDESCERGAECITRDVWREVEDGIKGIMGRITLADLVRKQHDRDARSVLSYVI